MSLAGYATSSSLRSSCSNCLCQLTQRSPQRLPSITARHRPLLPRATTSFYVTASRSAETLPSVSLSNASPGTQNPQPSVVRDHGSAGKDTEPIKERIQSTHPLRSDEEWPQSESASVRRVRSNKGRSLYERLETFRRGNELRNRMLKEKGSWSHDWRVALADLETHAVDDASNISTYPVALKSSWKSDIPRNIRAEDIPRPARWTKASFHLYVYQLTHSNVDRLVARKVYSEKSSHADEVVDVLESLFAEAELKYIISDEACNEALRFFFRCEKFARARDLFSRLQELQKNIHPSTYNIMMQAAAAQKDLFTFTLLLKTMISHGVRPDLYTWVHFAQAVEEKEVQLMILNTLVQKTAPQKNPALMRDIATLIIPRIASTYLERGQDPLLLLDDLDKSFEPGWLSYQACAQVLGEVATRHSIPKALLMLKEFYDRGFKPTQGLLLQLLKKCSYTRAHDLAIEILRLFRMEYTIQPSSQIYDVWFEQAWRSRLYNCCRVLWVHACVEGHTSFTMQQKVKSSLRVERSQSYSSHTRLQLWQATAGKVIAGCVRFDNVDSFWDMMSRWRPAQESFKDRDKFLRAARSSLDDDLAIVGRHSILKPLDELLSEALAVDRRWALGHALREVPIECKCSQVIDIHLVSKMPAEDADDRLQSAQPPSGTEHLMPTPVKSSRCWMSDEMRSKPCACPEWVKERMLAPSIATPTENGGRAEAALPETPLMTET